MKYDKNLLRRFNGSVRAIEEYCKGRDMAVQDLNSAYLAGSRRFVQATAVGGGGRVTYKRPSHPKYHKMGR